MVGGRGDSSLLRPIMLGSNADQDSIVLGKQYIEGASCQREGGGCTNSIVGGRNLDTKLI